MTVTTSRRSSAITLACALIASISLPMMSGGVAVAAPLAAAPAPDEINGVVWNDVNADGANDASENGLDGQLVTIFDALGAQVGQVTTGANGLYSFTGLNPADGPFRVTITRDPAVYPDPANWIASASTPTQAATYSGADQDFSRTAGAGVAVAEATGLVPGTSADAAIRPRPEIALGLFGPGVIDGGGDYNALGNCASPTDIAEPGDDCGPSNGQIRSNDILSTVWSVTADNFEPGTPDWGPVIFSQTITPAVDDPATPEDESAVVATFDGIPVSCVAPPNGTGGAAPPSQIITNADGGQTLICNLGQFAEGAQESLTIPVKVSGESANGSGFTLSQSAYVDGDRAVPATATPPIEMEVSARPAFDAVKVRFRNYDPTSQCIDTDGDAATPCEQLPGYFTYFLIRIASDLATGIEAIQQPYTIEDNITAVGADGITPYVPEFYITECRPNPSGWGDVVLGTGGGVAGDPGVATSRPERRVQDSGDCAVTRDDPTDNTSQYSFELDNADLDGSFFPTQTWGGLDLSAGPFIYVEHRVQVFIPNRSIDLSDGVIDNNGSFQMFNSYGGFDPDGLSGVSNFGDDVEPGYCPPDFSGNCDLMDDGSRSNNSIGPLTARITPPGGSWQKYQMYRVNYTSSGYSNIPGISALHAGNGIMEPGDVSTSQVRLRSVGSTGLSSPVVCDVFDSTVSQLALGDSVRRGSVAVPAGEYAFASDTPFAGTRNNRDWSERFVIEYAVVDTTGDDPLYNPARVGAPGVIDSSFYPGLDTYSTTTGRFEGVWDAQRAARCDDADATSGWTTDPNDPALGGIDNVNAVRMRPIDPAFVLEPSEYMTLNVPLLTRSTFVGGPYDGEGIPSGAVFANFGGTKAENWSTNGGIGNWTARAYNPSPESTSRDGDRFTIARFTTRLQKRTLIPATNVGVNGATLAGNEVVWELIPAISANTVPSSQVAENVVVYDVLPPFTSYNPACTAALNNDPATSTILPSLVEPNTDLNGPNTGYTLLTYVLGDLPANEPVPRIRVCTDTDALAPNGTQVTNYAEVQADDDITVTSTRSDTHAIVLQQNGAIQISKEVDRRLDPLDDTQDYTIRYANFAAAFGVEPTTMIDVFPWNGDGLGSASERDPASNFAPTSSLDLVAEPTVTFFDGSVPGPGDPFPDVGVLTYTADAPATIDYNPDANVSQWCPISDFGVVAGCPATLADVTAFKLVSNYVLERDGLPRQGHIVDFTLQATGNEPSDRYTNRATVDSESLPAAQFLRSNNVVVEVAGFNLGDLIFGDVNRDGDYDPGIDTPAPGGVVVELYRDGDTVPFRTVTTDAAGRYNFSGIGAGDYFVVVPDSEFGSGGLLEDWLIQPLGLDTDPNSDVNETGDHHAVGITPGTTTDGARSAGLITLSATIPASPLLTPTGDEPLGDNVGGLTDVVGDDFTNFTLDLGFIPPINPSIAIEKVTNGADADTGTGPYIAVGEAVTWTYTVTNTGDTALTDVVVIDDVEGPATFVLGDDNNNGAIDLAETWIYELTGVAGDGQYENEAVVTALPADPSGAAIIDAPEVSADDPSHYFGATTDIDIVKRVQNFFDADTPPGPNVAVGDAVSFTYVVTNTGTTRLIDLVVTDDVLGPVTCLATELAPGDFTTCLATAIATEGQYVNTGTAVGSPVDPAGEPIDGLDDPTDSDDAHYFGSNPSIDIEKSVQTTFDADDSGTGPQVAADGTVRFDYVVMNTGNVDLVDVIVTDDIEGVITCPADTLAVGASMTCTLTGVPAIDEGEYANIGTVTADGPTTIGPNGEVVEGAEVTDADAAHYTSGSPAIDIQKFVQTTWDSNDPATAPPISEGGPVLFTYVVTNTGLVDLTEVLVTDDIEGTITCPATALVVGESMTCTLEAVAVGDNYTNVGTVTADGPPTIDENGDSVPGESVTDFDPANYFGVDPSITIEKAVQTTFDADLPTGPAVAVGDVVRWTYTVTNNGNVPLTAVSVVDDQILNDSTINCGFGAQNFIPSLGIGQVVTCSVFGEAVAGQYTNTGTTTGTGPTTVGTDGIADEPGEVVTDVDDANYFGVELGIDIVKSVQGLDANDAPGPFVAPGADVTFTYVVTNTGNADLTDIVVTDDVEGVITCPLTALAVDESMTCELTTTAIADGQYTNTGSVVGVGPETVDADGNPVAPATTEAADDANYVVGSPSIAIVKSVQTLDANDAPGPFVAPGAEVTFTYVVTNDGDVDLTDVVVTDSVEGSVLCPSAILAIGESMTCELDAVAIADGQYTNTGTAVGVGPETIDENGEPVGGAEVEDADDANYFVGSPSIAIVKSVQTLDANDAPGPLVAAGADVTFTYVVTNDGDVDLTDVVVTDSVEGAVLCPSTVLAVGESMTCELDAVAIDDGQYTNTGTAVGTGPDTVDENGEPVDGPVVESTDDANYQVQPPAIDIETFVQTTFDADEPNGPAVGQGSDVMITYVVTNPSDVPISDVVVVDSTLGTPTFVGGDTNGDGLLDPDETWEYTLTIPADDLGVNASDATVTGNGPDTIAADGSDEPGAEVTDADPHHFEVLGAAITVEKFVQTLFDANDPPGPAVAEDSNVRFTYVVANTGNTPLTDVALIDDIEGPVTCPATELAVGESMTCELIAPATSGAYTNLGSVTGTAPVTFDVDGNEVPGAIVTDSDPANYFGQTTGVDIEKLVQTTFDADEPTGPLVALDAPVVWTYVVTNTGNVPLTDVVVSDDQLDDATIDCGLGSMNVIPALAAGAIVECSATGSAIAGQYTNTGSVVGVGPDSIDENGDPVDGVAVDDDDDANYFGSSPAIEVDKVVQGSFAADTTGDGPNVLAGTDVLFTYTVTNTGNTDLTGIALVDDIEGPVTCPATELAVGESMVCELTAPAIDGGDYANVGTATAVGPGTIDENGDPVDGIDVTDSDPGHYSVPVPSIDIETYVADTWDADTSATGPVFEPGTDTTITYVVTTPGTSPIADVVVTDSVYGTPTFVGGDTNGDGILDPDETWTYTIVVSDMAAGDVTADATATGVGPASIDASGALVDGVPVDDADPHNFSAAAAGVEVEKSTNGADSDDGSGESIVVGSTVEWLYEITNTGATALIDIDVSDDDPAVTVDCGDGTGLIAVLLPGQTARCTAQGTAVSGDYQNIATVAGVSGTPNPETCGCDITDPSTWPSDPELYLPVLGQDDEGVTTVATDPSRYNGVPAEPIAAPPGGLPTTGGGLLMVWFALFFTVGGAVLWLSSRRRRDRLITG